MHQHLGEQAELFPGLVVQLCVHFLMQPLRQEVVRRCRARLAWCSVHDTARWRTTRSAQDSFCRCGIVVYCSLCCFVALQVRLRAFMPWSLWVALAVPLLAEQPVRLSVFFDCACSVHHGVVKIELPSAPSTQLSSSTAQYRTPATIFSTQKKTIAATSSAISTQ